MFKQTLHQFSLRISNVVNSKIWAIFFLLVVVIIFMWRVVITGKVFLPLDMIYHAEPWRSEIKIKNDSVPWNSLMTDSIWQFAPVAEFVKRSVPTGSLFWEPNILSGMPGLARGDLFSQPIFLLLSLVMPVEYAISWSLVLHLIIGAIFTYLLLREMLVSHWGAIIGSLSFILGGYLVAWLQLPNFVTTLIWLPVIFWGYERAIRKKDWRWTLVGAAGFFLQILGGYILWPFYSAITLTIFAIYRAITTWIFDRDWLSGWASLFYVALILGLGSLLAAFQLLPTLQLFLRTQRTEQLGVNSFIDIYKHLLRLLAPGISGTDVMGNKYRGEFNYAETALYIGVLPLLFFLLAVIPKNSNRRIAWGLVGISLLNLLAVYNLFPARQIVGWLNPFFVNTFPGRVFSIVSFTGALAAGIGFDRLVQLHRTKGFSILTFILFLSGLVFMAMGLIFSLDSTVLELNWIEKLTKRLDITNAASLYWVGIIFIVSSFLFLIWQKQWISEKIFSVLVVLIISTDLLYISINHNPAFDAEMSFPQTESLDYLEKLKSQDQQPFRILNINSASILPGMTNEKYDLSTISGYSSWILSRYAEYAELSDDYFSSGINNVYFDDCCSPLTDALNVKYVLSERQLSNDYSLIAHLDEAEILAITKKKLFPTVWSIGESREVLLQYAPGKIRFPLIPGDRAYFSTWLAIHPDVWERSNGVKFVVSIQDMEGRELFSFSEELDPKANLKDRAWVPVGIDLSPYARQSIWLELTTLPNDFHDSKFDWAGWGEPIVQQYRSDSLRPLFEGENIIYENLNVLPRAWVVHHTIPVEPDDLTSIEDILQNPEFDPGRSAVVEGPLSLQNAKEGVGDFTRITLYRNQRVNIEANLEAPGLLILSDVMYPGWEAHVDGKKQPILTTNMIMRGVYLDSGKHQVEFIYRPYLFWIGLGITLLTVLFICITVVLYRKNKNPASRHLSLA